LAAQREKHFAVVVNRISKSKSIINTILKACIFVENTHKERTGRCLCPINKGGLFEEILSIMKYRGETRKDRLIQLPFVYKHIDAQFFQFCFKRLIDSFRDSQDHAGSLRQADTI